MTEEQITELELEDAVPADDPSVVAEDDPFDDELDDELEALGTGPDDEEHVLGPEGTTP